MPRTRTIESPTLGSHAISLRRGPGARWTAGVALVAIVVAVALVSRRQRNSTLIQAEDRHASFTAKRANIAVFTVRLAEVPQLIEVSGTVRAELESTVATKVQGRVLRVLAREGDNVQKGQPLIELDARDQEAAIAQAEANLRAAQVGYDNSRVVAAMEDSASAARIADAKARVIQGEAGVNGAQSRLEMVLAGPRKQERAQASLAVVQAKSGLDLAASNLKRMKSLVDDGAISLQQYDTARAQYEVADAQYRTAQQAESIAAEGSRAEEIRTAREAERQAQAELEQARAGLGQAEAGALQVRIKKQEIGSARAQVSQSEAALRASRVTRDYATITAPFDGVVTARLADPGTLAGPGTPLMRLQGGAVRLEAIVPESALKAVRHGGRLDVRLDALGGRTLPGTVAEVSPQGDAGTHSFKVKIDLPRRVGAKSGMFGRSDIRTGTEEQILVPKAAVVEREGLSYVHILGDRQPPQLRLITIGEGMNGMIPVLSGLQPGERVVADASHVSGVPTTRDMGVRQSR